MKAVTVFVGCDFHGTGPRKVLDRFLKSFKDIQVLPIFSCSSNSDVIQAFGRKHRDYDAMIGSHGMMGKTYALIKNSDFFIFDLTGYRANRRYCLNAI